MERLKKNSVLIVDDEKANIIALTHILSTEYTIYAAKNGQDALETAKEFLPDIILLDIIMPEMDGYEVLSLLKKAEKTREIPVIFITGLIKVEDEEKGMALGATDYITKPFSPEIVRLRIRNQIHILDQIKMIKQSSIVENSPNFIMYLSPSGELSYLNPFATEMTGHTKAEIMLGGLGLIFDAETARVIKDTYIQKTLQKGVDNFEVNMKRKDGKIRILAFTSFTAEKDNIGAIARDVTEMRAMEAELITAKEQAEQNNRAKTEFLSRMSHEMRTPMNAIIGMASILKISDEAEKKAQCLEEIDKASRHLLSVIDDVLDISKLEKNTLALDHSEFCFNTMLSNILKTVQKYTDGKRQTLSHIIDPLIPGTLIGDEKRLTQVIHNLLTNANKFSPEGGTIQLDARLAGEEDGAVLLKIEVSDNGIGIPEEKQAMIFVSFEQADGSFSRKFEGVGLGLTISKHLVEMMGGKIWVKSKPGNGAKFSFTCKVKSVHKEKLALNGVNKSQMNFKGKTALLVEDIKINRDIITAMLEDSQIQIDYAENGWQAVELFTANSGKYDIILMAINMPGMNGWETSRRIRAIGVPEGKPVKIIAMTTNIFQENMEKNLEAGIDDHISKPIDYNALFHKLDQHFS